ncbi:AAA family ATPase [Pseudomonas oryzihabitans]|uniref:AAA family ATPase n=1 Tax=Pseudomonas oryzihabitans TaxID=47885 RepID=UPI00286C4720|nr:AAA family ATPase [Pseudomonas psychrotolerans]
MEANYSEVKSIGGRIAKALSESDLQAAQQIKSIIRKKGVPLRSSGYTENLPVDPKSRMPLVEEQSWPVTPLFLDENAINVFETFISDAKNISELIENGLGGRLNLLLSGPPGTGKSLVAGHLAAQLGKPLYVVRLDSIISSLLGDTAKNIRQIFDYVPQRGGVLFLDEVDAVAKLRDDQHEIGELKRVVNTLIQGLDSLDDNAIVIAATNHGGLLDPAIWRRFPYKIDFGIPGIDVKCDLWNHFLFKDEGDTNICKSLATISPTLTGADIESIAFAARRRSLLTKQALDLAAITCAALYSKPGNAALPSPRGIQNQDKKEVAIKLNKEFKISQTEVSKLLNVSRQTVSSYIKE